MRKATESRMRARLQTLRDDVEAIEHWAAQTETRLELEYYTLLEELRLGLESAERKFELLVESHDDQWQETSKDFEQIWRATRELIRAVNSP